MVLCTPSADAPIWLTEKHPEVLMIDADGRQMQHGTREQADWSVDLYRQYVGKIDEELAKHYGNNPTVWGWQIDNELGHYGKEPSYTQSSQAKFRLWLQKKYGTIETLNTDWGTAFWSQRYENFDQVRLANAKRRWPRSIHISCWIRSVGSPTKQPITFASRPPACANIAAIASGSPPTFNRIIRRRIPRFRPTTWTW